MDWEHCDTNDLRYYYTFQLGSVHDVITSVIKTRKQDASGNLVSRRTLPLREVSWAPSDCRVRFDEAATLRQLDGDDCVVDVPHPSTDMEDRLAVGSRCGG